ncbi:DUF6303 family protein [Streptomyces bobili]|uniref:DUF6303 family protein n=1 Tax=Streptomyces bobili TaxID=67280 RepID=UPI003826ABF9
MTPKARMSLGTDGKHWHLYVVMGCRVYGWPETTFPAAAGIPAEADRDAALARLGYQVDDTTGWTWINDILASVAVRPL